MVFILLAHNRSCSTDKYINIYDSMDGVYYASIELTTIRMCLEIEIPYNHTKGR
jgi:hypothetical protein